MNLLGNSIKFTESGSVTLRVMTLAEADASISLRLEVEDTGPGLANDQIDRLFGAFEQADVSTTRVYGGTGLGLAITKQIAQLMGGSIGAKNNIGRGSTFWIDVKLEFAADHMSSEGDLLLEDAHFVTRPMPLDSDPAETIRETYQQARVLLAEDHPINQMVSLELLKQVGLLADLAVDGEEAVKMAARGDYDVILMDMQMPKLDGVEAAKVIRKNDSTQYTPIIALTANAYSHDRGACLAAGMNDFLSKPFEPVELYSVLCRWLLIVYSP